MKQWKKHGKYPASRKEQSARHMRGNIAEAARKGTRSKVHEVKKKMWPYWGKILCGQALTLKKKKRKEKRGMGVDEEVRQRSQDAQKLSTC